MTACVTFSPGATSCRRAALGTSARTRCSAPWACCSSASAAMLVPCREPATKPVGKPDAGNPHVRFDERGGETDRSRGTAPLLDSTAKIAHSYTVAELGIGGFHPLLPNLIRGIGPRHLAQYVGGSF